MSRMTNVSTTFAKNSDACRSFMSNALRTSTGKAAYSGAMPWGAAAFVCSSRTCDIWKSFDIPWTYSAGESKLSTGANVSQSAGRDQAKRKTRTSFRS